ncbi:hypothetical protein SKAU_G00091090 [Synaphobranchus kaupii]|uniref:Uncharacterized protein n=1 Tax=Synaphobranchus kaupii TaxID=118154 RepID=A0A9Q1FXK9_SYNKA|nr:hypothetical protein SKAU_G00091090 [Synaphobranchus kaupii]
MNPKEGDVMLALPKVLLNMVNMSFGVCEVVFWLWLDVGAVLLPFFLCGDLQPRGSEHPIFSHIRRSIDTACAKIARRRQQDKVLLSCHNS